MVFRTNAETLELYRVALENAETQSKIAAIMAELGFDSAVIGEGKVILAKTRKAYDLIKTEDDESSAAYADFAGKKELLEDTFNPDLSLGFCDEGLKYKKIRCLGEEA